MVCSWSSWNAFGDLSTHRPPIGSKELLEIADIVVSSGLRDAGYVNFNVDAGWSHVPSKHFYGRGANGTLQPNPELFPEGMKSFCDELHSRGLKCGLYTGFAPMVCGFMNGSWGYETVDADTFAAWGVDLVKNDWCYNAGDAIEKAAPSAFRKMRDALNATGRKIIYAIHGKGGPGSGNDAWPTYYEDAPSIANSWRMGGDIEGPMHPSWAGVLRLIDSETQDNTTTGISGPNAWNDCDMMVVGQVRPRFLNWGACASTEPCPQHLSLLARCASPTTNVSTTCWLGFKFAPHVQGLSATEDRAHVSMWAMLASPMIVGYDLRNSSAETIASLTHKGIVRISQDPLGKQATLVPRSAAAQAAGIQVWHRPLVGGEMAVALLNRGESAQKFRVRFDSLGWKHAAGTSVTDVWSGSTNKSVMEGWDATVGPHAAEVFVLAKA